MTIETIGAVDFLTLEDGTGDILLTISDHLDWIEDEAGHLSLLKDKLNAYLRFVEGGEMAQKFPVSVGRRVVVEIVGKFPQSEKATEFFELAQTALLKLGIPLRFRLH